MLDIGNNFKPGRQLGLYLHLYPYQLLLCMINPTTKLNSIYY